MRLKRHVSLLDTALRRPVSHSLLPALHLRCVAHRYSSTTGDSPANVAVLGGGVAGLSSAYFISKNFPQSKITVYESASEAGGWIRSKRVEVPGGDIVFESGPRTLRYSSITAHLIQDLGLTNDLTYTLKTDPAAANRFIYYPDRLNKISFNGMSIGEVFSMWRGGLLRGISGFGRELLTNRRPASLHDETVGSWITRRLDKRLANNLISAVFHGIYAGDIWQLSAKTLLPLPWHLEGKYESAIVGHFDAARQQPPSMLAHPYDIEVARAVDQDIDLDPKFLQRLQDASTYTFQNGLQHLIHKLQASLEANPNVSLKFNTPVISTKYEASEQPKVALTADDSSSPTTTSYDFVVSSLRHPTLTPYVTVMTVNLYYPTPNITPEPGFGYLLPQSLPFTQNPERALGVIFDSDAACHQDTASGTKLTVMLGGHWWDGWAGYPTEAEGVDMAKNVVARHLGITEAPAAWNVGLHRDCIPQYTLGYEDRLATFQDELADEFKGRLRVVGNQVNGVGINDCVAGAWNLAREMKWGGWRGRSVGLEKVRRRGEEWRLVPIRQMGYRTS